MIFRANNKNVLPERDQQGITLLLSVLLLAAITTIAFSLAAVGFAEISTSDDLARTEPILYHSLGIAEEATYGMKRGVASIKTELGTECDANFKTYILTSSKAISTKTKVCNLNPTNDIEISIPVNTANTAQRLYVYDPANNGTKESGYTQISFIKTTNNGGDIRLYICQLDKDCAFPGTAANGWIVNGPQLNYGNPAYVVSLTNSPASSCCSYEVWLINQGSSKDFVEVITQPKGLPYLNKEAVEIQSAYGRLIRRLRVLVPTQ